MPGIRQACCSSNVARITGCFLFAILLQRFSSGLRHQCRVFRILCNVARENSLLLAQRLG